MADNIYTVCVSLCDIKGTAQENSVIGSGDSQLLFGEAFKAEREDGEWVYGRSIVDGYSGYIHKANLASQVHEATHIFTHRQGHIYPQADFKTTPIMTLHMMSRLSVNPSSTQNGFVSVPNYGWVFQNHITSRTDNAANIDFVETALLFIGAPYLYGGRCASGIDCSGLIQIALSRSGISSPRDTKDQISLGISTERKDVQRGDLVFFDGHIGIMVDSNRVLNATSRTMDVRVEELNDLEKIYNGITDIRRI